MIGAFNFKSFAVIDAPRDVEDHSVVEEVGAGEAEAVVAVGLSEMGSFIVIKFCNNIRLILILKSFQSPCYSPYHDLHPEFLASIFLL